MKNYKFKVGMQNLIPIYGLKKFSDENPIPKGDDLRENRKYATIALPLGLYNLACTIAVAGGIVIGISKGLEALLK